MKTWNFINGYRLPTTPAEGAAAGKRSWWLPAMLMLSGVTASAQTSADTEAGELLEFLGEFGIEDEWLDPMEIEKWPEGNDEDIDNLDNAQHKTFHEHEPLERSTPPHSGARSRWLLPDKAAAPDNSEDQNDDEN